ncbi:MAG: hypothetical protein IJY11_03870 [Clostridia bacterium]|nr:hypothetical protein [Clostridia bacterium]
MKNFSIALPLDTEYFTTVRLTTGGICALADFDVESTEDVKVCVTESLLILKRSGFTSARVLFSHGSPMLCEIVGEDREKAPQEGIDDEISFALLSALLGEVDFEKDGQGKVVAVKFNA